MWGVYFSLNIGFTLFLVVFTSGANRYPSISAPPRLNVSIFAMECWNLFGFSSPSSFHHKLSRNSVYRGPKCSGKKPIRVKKKSCKKCKIHRIWGYHLNANNDLLIALCRPPKAGDNSPLPTAEGGRY